MLRHLIFRLCHGCFCLLLARLIVRIGGKVQTQKFWLKGTICYFGTKVGAFPSEISTNENPTTINWDHRKVAL